MENDFRGLEDLIKNVVQESDCPFSTLPKDDPPQKHGLLPISLPALFSVL
jgi:hypothetical protein